MSDIERIDEALDQLVTADGIDGEEAYHRQLAVDAFRRLATPPSVSVRTGEQDGHAERGTT